MRANLLHLLRPRGTAVTALALVLGLSTAALAHQDVVLRGYDGQVIDPASSSEPYSPKNTCIGTAGCHDYDAITSAYHFQQGFDQVSDTFNPDKPWVKSPGMYGKW